MVLIQSFIASCITVTLTEICKIGLLKTTNDPQITIFYSSIFGYTIAYIAQRYVFNSFANNNKTTKTTKTSKTNNNSSNGNFFGISLLKYIAVSSISVQLYGIILKTLLNITFIKQLVNNPNITSTRKRIYQYLIINISIFMVFLCIDFPMRKYFIFANYTDNDYKFSYILYFIALMIYLYTHNDYILTKSTSTLPTISTLPTTSTLPIIIKT